MLALKFYRKMSISLTNSNLNRLLLKTNFKEIYINKLNRTIHHTNLMCRNEYDDFKKVSNAGEKKLLNLLRKRFPNAKTIEVNDISGGCGNMYEIFVETNEFKNIRKVKQHQMINQALQAEIRNNMHGLRIYTAASEN
jgi:stress-induced morphogen